MTIEGHVLNKVKRRNSLKFNSNLPGKLEGRNVVDQSTASSSKKSQRDPPSFLTSLPFSSFEKEDESSRRRNEQIYKSTSFNAPLIAKESSDTHEMRRRRSFSAREKNHSGKTLGRFLSFKKDLINYPLEQTLEECGGVPLIVTACIDKMTELRAWESEGIFRTNPAEDLVKAALDNFQHNGREAIDRLTDVDIVAVVLKRYLRDFLPDSLIPYPLQDQFLDCIQDDTRVDADTLKNLITNLPEAHKKTLLQVMSLLATIASMSEESSSEHSEPSQGHNFMTSQNLAIVFQPTLLRFPPNASHYEMMDNSKRLLLVKAMIDNYNKLFVWKTQGSSSSSPAPLQLSSSENAHCPLFVKDCIQRLIELEAYKQQGIGRISGSNFNVAQIAEIYPRNRQAVTFCDSAHTLMTFFKESLMELSGPAIPQECNDRFIELDFLQKEEFTTFIQSLPAANQAILKLVLHFFKLVADHCETSKMSSSSCAVCISQNLIHLENSNYDSKAEQLRKLIEMGDKIGKANERIRFMIDNYDELFPVDQSKLDSIEAL